MNNFSKFSRMMSKYLAEHGYEITLESKIADLSQNEETGKPLCTAVLAAIDMDTFAKKGYRKIIIPNSTSEDDTINTADAFLIIRENTWYFIEFKDVKINDRGMKASVLKTAYSNLYAVMDVLYSMKETEYAYTDFNYENPVEFVRNNVVYILVFSSIKNPRHVEQLKNHQLLNEKYLPEFMKRLPGYIYKEAYALTETEFEHSFPRNFAYQ